MRSILEVLADLRKAWRNELHARANELRHDVDTRRRWLICEGAHPEDIYRAGSLQLAWADLLDSFAGTRPCDGSTPGSRR